MTEAEFKGRLSELYRNPATQPLVFGLRNQHVNAMFAGNTEEAERCLDKLVALFLQGEAHDERGVLG